VSGLYESDAKKAVLCSLCFLTLTMPALAAERPRPMLQLGHMDEITAIARRTLCSDWQQGQHGKPRSQTDGMEQHFPARGPSSTWLRHQQSSNTGGERGIRTPDTRKGIHAFEARAFSHSAISPRPQVSFLSYQGSCWLRISPPISLN
jgi:hypothetical protein